MTPIPTNPRHQPETEFHGETQVFSGRALAPNDPSLEPRVRKGRPADREKLNGAGNERSPEQDTENLN